MAPALPRCPPHPQELTALPVQVARLRRLRGSAPAAHGGLQGLGGVPHRRGLLPALLQRQGAALQGAQAENHLRQPRHAQPVGADGRGAREWLQHQSISRAAAAAPLQGARRRRRQLQAPCSLVQGLFLLGKLWHHHVLAKVAGAWVHPWLSRTMVPRRKPGKEEAEQSRSCWDGCMAQGSKHVRNCGGKHVQAWLCLPGAVMFLRMSGLALQPFSCHLHATATVPAPLPLCHGWPGAPSARAVCVVQSCWCAPGLLLVHAWGLQTCFAFGPIQLQGSGETPKLHQVKLWPLFFSSPVLGGDSFA